MRVCARACVRLRAWVGPSARCAGLVGLPSVTSAGALLGSPAFFLPMGHRGWWSFGMAVRSRRRAG
eukprot:9786001-Alexandrium_andersonii.AAC.1